MSPRAALWLEVLGFQKVYDYVAGKADWLAHGLPVEGTGGARRTVGPLARQDAVTCRLGEPAEAVRRRVEASPYGFGLVVTDADVVLGRVRVSALRDATGRVDDVLESGPSTVRPDLATETAALRMKDHSLTALIVTDPEGRLMGVARRRDTEGAC